MRAAVLIAACLVLGCAGREVPSCAGWEKLSPSAPTQKFIVNNDPKFGGQVIGHNDFGALRGCWK